MKGGFFPAKTNWEEPDTDMAQDYNATLNLPKTAFPMRGNLPKREPDVLGKWEEQDLYEKMVQKNQGRPMYVLHDGPPYANGEIHLGTALNKVLKDFIIKLSVLCNIYKSRYFSLNAALLASPVLFDNSQSRLCKRLHFAKMQSLRPVIARF